MQRRATLTYQGYESSRNWLTAEQRIEWYSSGIDLVIDVSSGGHVLLRSIRPAGSRAAVVPRSKQDHALLLVEMRLAGNGCVVWSSQRQIGSPLGRRL